MLKIQNLCHVFNKGTANENKLFNRLCLNVKKGDFITVIGSNGAGKSTLLNLISGTIKPDSGSIMLDSNELCGLSEYKCAKYMGRVFQDPSMGVAPEMTILENMSIAQNKGKKFGLSRGVNKKNLPLFKNMLKEMQLGLEDKLNTKVGLLSGGQRQSLSLLMTVMSKPELLLLDEHTAALDPKTSERIIELTKRVVEENHITTIMVTHNLKHALSLGNRLLMMHQGEIVLDVRGEEKGRVTIELLMRTFDKLQGTDMLSDRALFS